MKKYIFLLLLVFVCTSCAEAWGLFPSIASRRSLLFSYLGKKQVVQPVCIRTHVQGNIYTPGLPADVRQINEEQVIVQLEKALNWWLEQVPQYIRESGREQEFADALAVIPTSVRLKKQVSCEGNGILIFTYSPYHAFVDVVEKNGKKVLVHKDRPTLVSVPYGNAYELVARAENEDNYHEIRFFHPYFLNNQDLELYLPHEVGHLYGLADQYNTWESEKERIHPYFSFMTLFGKYGARQRNGKSFSVRSIFGQGRHDRSILDKIPADDVDGFINAVDFVQFYDRGKNSARISGGWSSFSLPDKHVYYAYSMPFVYEGDPALLSVPSSIFERIKELQLAAGRINVDDIHQMEKYYALLGSYRAALVKQKNSFAQRPIAHKDRLRDYTDAELKSLMNLARYHYYDNRLLEVDTLLASYYDPFHHSVAGYRSEEEQENERRSGQYGVSKFVDGKLYFAYDPAQMNNLLQATEKFIQKHPDFPNHPEQIQYEELKQTGTEHTVRSYVRYCAICGQELTDEDSELITFGPSKARAVYFWIHRKERDQMFISPGQVNPKFSPIKKYTFKTQQAAGGEYCSITYQMALEELQSRETSQRLKEAMPVFQTDKQAQPSVKTNQTAAHTGGKKQELGRTTTALATKDPVVVSAAPTEPTSHKATSTPASKSKQLAPAHGTKSMATSAARTQTRDVPEQSLTATQHKLHTVAASGAPQKPAVESVNVSVREHKSPQKPDALAVKAPKTAPLDKVEPVLPKQNIWCNVCGKVIDEHSHFYSIDEQHGVHANHSLCAYTYFAQQHDVSDEALASYESVYFLKVPANVSAARNKMRALELTIADLRRYRSQERFHTKPQQTPQAAKLPEGTSIRTQFLQAVRTFQQNARVGKKDPQRAIEGSYQLVEAYFAGRNKQSYLSTMEWFVSLDRVLSSGSKDGKIYEYIAKLLNGKIDKSITTHYKDTRLKQLRADFSKDRQAYKKYAPVVTQLVRLRLQAARQPLARAIADGSVQREKLTPTQVKQIESMMSFILPFAQQLAQVKDPAVFAQIAQGLQKEPILTKDRYEINLGKFLEMYGFYTPHTAKDGSMLSNIGKSLQKGK